MNNHTIAPKILFVLGGVIIKNPNGTWRTSRFDEGDNFGVLGDYVRPKAAAVLFAKNPNLYIVAVGGKGQLAHMAHAPTSARVLLKEMVAEGIPEASIDEENESGSSYEQLVACSHLARNTATTELSILSNEYHLPRLQTLIEYSSELIRLSQAHLISAESVLIEHDRSKWERLIHKAYASKSMQKRMVLEQQGVDDIKNRCYLFRGGEV